MQRSFATATPVSARARPRTLVRASASVHTQQQHQRHVRSRANLTKSSLRFYSSGGFDRSSGLSERWRSVTRGASAVSGGDDPPPEAYTTTNRSGDFPDVSPQIAALRRMFMSNYPHMSVDEINAIVDTLPGNHEEGPMSFFTDEFDDELKEFAAGHSEAVRDFNRPGQSVEDPLLSGGERLFHRMLTRNELPRRDKGLFTFAEETPVDANGKPIDYEQKLAEGEKHLEEIFNNELDPFSELLLERLKVSRHIIDDWRSNLVLQNYVLDHYTGRQIAKNRLFDWKKFKLNDDDELADDFDAATSEGGNELEEQVEYIEENEMLEPKLSLHQIEEDILHTQEAFRPRDFGAYTNFVTRRQPRDDMRLDDSKDNNYILDPLNVEFLLRFMDPMGNIIGRRFTGVTPRQQRRLSRTIKRARHLGYFSYKKGAFKITHPFAGVTGERDYLVDEIDLVTTLMEDMLYEEEFEEMRKEQARGEEVVELS